MCEVCSVQGEDYRYKNGATRALTNGNLYKVFKDAVATIRLCHVHSVELFRLGERRFLQEHILFARTLAQKAKKASSDSDSSFGL